MSIFFYLKSPFFYITLFVPFLLILGFGEFIPAGALFSTILITSYIIIAMFLFGGIILEIRKTSFIKSISLTKVNKTNFIIVNILITFVSMFFLSNFVILIFFLITNYTNIIATDWSAFGPSAILITNLFGGNIDWNNIRWIQLYYSIFVSIFASIIFSFFLISVIKTKIPLYLFSFFYLILFWIITWFIIPSIVPYWRQLQYGSKYDYLIFFRYLLPHYWSGVLMSESLPLFSSGINLNIGGESIFVTSDQLFNIFNRINEAGIDLSESFEQNIPEISIIIGDVLSINPRLVEIFLENNKEGIKSYLDSLDSIVGISKYYIFNRDNFLDINSVKSFFITFGTIVISFPFLLLGLKNFSWSLK